MAEVPGEDGGAHEAGGDAVGDAEGAELVADGVGASQGDAGADGFHGEEDAELGGVDGGEEGERWFSLGL